MLSDTTGEMGSSDAITEPDAPSQLTVDVSELEGRTCVTLAGELDGVSVPPLRDRLADLRDQQLGGDLVLDLAGVTFLDSTALTLFVLLHKSLAHTGHELILLSPSPMARRVFQITGLDEFLRIEPSTH